MDAAEPKVDKTGAVPSATMKTSAEMSLAGKPTQINTVKKSVEFSQEKVTDPTTGSVEEEAKEKAKGAKSAEKLKIRTKKSDGRSRTEVGRADRSSDRIKRKLKLFRPNARKEPVPMHPNQTQEESVLSSSENDGKSLQGTSSTHSKSRTRRKKRRRKAPVGLFDLLNGPKRDLAAELLGEDEDEVEEFSMDSDKEDSSDSVSIALIESEETAKYIDGLRVGKLSRLAQRRTMWTSRMSSYFPILTFLLSYDTLIAFTGRFDYHGSAFIVAYCITLVVVGFPLMYLELALGQYTSTNAFAIFNNMCPALAGIGVVALMLNFWTMLSDQMVITFFINILFHAGDLFSGEMPWQNCITSDNKANCRQLNRDCKNLVKKFNGKNKQHEARLEDAYLKYQVFGDSCLSSQSKAIRAVEFSDFYEDWPSWFERDSVAQYFFPNVNIAAMTSESYPTWDYYYFMMAAWLLVTLACMRGSRFVVLLSKFALLLLVVTIITLMSVLMFIKPPEFPYLNAVLATTSLNSASLWSDAIFLTLRSLKLGQGGLIFLGSQHNFHNNLFNDCLLILVLVAFIPYIYSLFHLILLDSFDMWMAKGDMTVWTKAVKATEASKIYSSSNQAVHVVVLTQALRSFEAYEPFALFVFSLMGISLVLANKVIRIEILVSAILDAFPSIRWKQGRTTVLGTIVAIAIVVMFILVSQNGFEVMVTMEKTSFPILAVVVVQLEIIAVIVFYGARRLFANITFMITRGTAEGLSEKADQIMHAVVLLLWVAVIPCGLWFAIFSGDNTELGKPLFPYLLVIGTIGVVPAILGYRVISHWQASKSFPLALFRVNPELWGPRSLQDRERATRKEREIRGFC